MDFTGAIGVAASIRGRALELPRWIKETNPAYVQGSSLLEAGNFAEAETSFAKASSELNSNRIRHAKALLGLAKAQWKQEKLNEARDSALSAHALLVSKRKPSSDLSVCLDLLGSLQESDGDKEGAAAFFREALDIQKKVFPLQFQPLVERHRRLARALAQSNPAEARDLFEQAVKLSERRLGKRSLATAECLLDLGQFELTQGDKDPGVATMERALEIHRDTNGETCEEIARGLQSAAAACQQSGDLETAVEYYERALRVRERQVGGNSTDFATLLSAFAAAHTLMGNTAPAMELLQQAVSKLSNTGDGRLAGALETLGEVYALSNRFNEAATYFKKARVIWEKNPQVHSDALRVNTSLLEGARQYVPVQPVPVSMFSQGPRPQGLVGRLALFPEHIPATPAPAQPAETVQSSYGARLAGAPAAPAEGYVPSRVAAEPVYSPPPVYVAPAPTPYVAPAPATPYVAPAPTPPPAYVAPPPVPKFEAPPEAPLPPPVVHVTAATLPQYTLTPPPPPVSVPVRYDLPPPDVQTGYVPVTQAAPQQPMQQPMIAVPQQPVMVAQQPPAPIPQSVGGSNLFVSWVNADGSPAATGPAAAPQDPVQLRIVVPESGMPREALLAPLEIEPPSHHPDLNGWEDLSYEFLTL